MNANGSRQDSRTSAIRTWASQGPKVKKTKRNDKNKQATICLFGEAIAKGLANTRLAACAVQQKCYVVGASPLLRPRVGARSEDRESRRDGSHRRRDIKARKRANTRSLMALGRSLAPLWRNMAILSSLLSAMAIRFFSLLPFPRELPQQHL